jgi:hypothetical protein
MTSSHTKVLVFTAALALPFSAALAQLEQLGEVPRTEIVREYTLLDASPDEDGIHRMAILRALDKNTGRAVNLSAPAGGPVNFGTLTIAARYCYTVPPEEPPETSAFIQIDDRERNVGDPVRIFSGWMFASSPAINALEHGVYDVWVINCNTDAPPEPDDFLAELDPLAQGALDSETDAEPSPELPSALPPEVPIE